MPCPHPPLKPVEDDDYWREPTAGRVRYPDPPRTKGIDPDHWPVAADLSNEQLRRRLNQVKEGDRRLRSEPDLTERGARQRRGVNAMCADLVREAQARGWQTI